MGLKKKDRAIVFQKFGGKCAYCGCDLQRGWHADHIEPVVRLGGEMRKPENERLDNYNPSCPPCNRLKSSLTIENFRDIIKGFVSSLNNYHSQYKFAKKYGLVEETKKPVVFYFEQVTTKD